MTAPYGAHVSGDLTTFTVHAPTASAVELCLFEQGAEVRLGMARVGGDGDGDGEGEGDAGDWTLAVQAPPGTRYGYRADGAPPHDAAKLLVDPHAIELDRAFAFDARLAEPGIDTAALVPKAIVPSASAPAAALAPIGFSPGGLIYELNVRGFTMRHPDVPAAQRGTLAALAHPAVIAHLKRLGVDAVELMPIVAWINERHLPPLGLANAWGYNPVVPMALDPRLAPGGIAELRAAVAALHGAGIAVILDLVFNHTGESDMAGPTLSLRGLDPAAYLRRGDGTLVNDAGTGNTLDTTYPPAHELILASLRHFAHAGIDGFRFDLAPIVVRGGLAGAIAADPVLATRTMIAEPWDCAGYHLGSFPAGWLEWNDRYRDDVRRFWRGDGGAGALASRLSGSSDVFGDTLTRTVNFVAAHDGFTLADLVAHERRHNEPNGEGNRDGHAGEIAWNNGAEGPSDDSVVRARRAADVRALLSTLFASRGTIMLAAGDEFGRTQRGNNNAYAQDNACVWLDWQGRDRELEAFVAALSKQRRALSGLADPAMLHDARWFRLDGAPLRDEDWACADGFEMRLANAAIRIDRIARAVTLAKPPSEAEGDHAGGRGVE